MPTLKSIKALKSKIKKKLPCFISDTLDNYSDFSSFAAPADAKGFAAHHSACKAALVHIEELLKIAKWSDEAENQQSGKTANGEPDFVSMAKEALSQEQDFSNEDYGYCEDTDYEGNENDQDAN